MRTIIAGQERIQSLKYTPDSRSLVVDLRRESQAHPSMGFEFRPARQLLWFDIFSGKQVRNFRLRDTLYGPGGFQSSLQEERYRVDRSPDGPAIDVAFSLEPLWVATVWEWTNKEDAVCVFDLTDSRAVNMRVPHKTHTAKIAFASGETTLLLATVNDMDGSALFEVWHPTLAVVESEEEAVLGGWQRDMLERNRALRMGCVNPYERLDGLAFDGRFAAAFQNDTMDLLLWDTRTAPTLERLRIESPVDLDWDVTVQEGSRATLEFAPWCLAFAPFGSRLAVGGAGLVLFDPLLSAHKQIDRTGSSISAVAFSPDGKDLVAGTQQGEVESWDIETGRLRRTFDWGCGPITALAFAPNGETCVCGTESGRMVVWDRDGD